MIHSSKFAGFEHQFPEDKRGHIPVHEDHWKEMDFDYGDMDPNEPDISAEEKARRLKYLNDDWWPKILERVQNERQRLEAEHGETFVSHWSSVVHQPPEDSPGFQVADV